ncbi:hypothetical protein [Bdellovibrio svalbardensis]|uniref:Uncharacterized protein n=1 Tax=Bdellovibrio svalbardensis TaxID=2972972 RepID=A0ABT6DLR9_9BACT|nr:hypothetical protein [Bdellovibrio svalbardensis]MDG0817596.1 hypothetical protein [Bdellovibrio svalbardensis]
MDIVLAMSIFFVVVTMIFVAIAFLMPELMGITGKKAKKIIEDQREQGEKPKSDPASDQKEESEKEL